MPSVPYPLSNRASEAERLTIQSRSWEPAGRALLAELPRRDGARALDVGCGPRGWLPLLDEWVGPGGTVVGSDIGEQHLEDAAAIGLERLALVRDDLFDSRLEPGSFDLIHARFQIAPLGRGAEQIAAHLRLLAPGGLLVLEEPDTAGWGVRPDGPAVLRVIGAVRAAFLAARGDLDAGRTLPSLLASATGVRPGVRAHVLALTHQDPYSQLPLQFARSLGERLELAPDVLEQAAGELADTSRWSVSYMLVQAWVQLGRAT